MISAHLLVFGCAGQLGRAVMNATMKMGLREVLDRHVVLSTS